MESQVIGTTLPLLEIKLAQGESLVSEAGEAAWFDHNIDIRTAATGVGGARSGLRGALDVAKRAVGGSSIFMSEYTAADGPGMISFGTKVPGEILPMHAEPGKAHLVHSYGFIAGETTTELSVGFQKKLGAGVFGGAGVILQKVGGSGEWWCEMSGVVKEIDLQPGYHLRVHPGHLGMFEESVEFKLTMIKGVKNKIFGQGLFFAELTGPGKVWLQSISLASLAGAIAPYIVTDESSGNSSSFIENIVGS
ncbi:MAG TPA: AIM24 family protein [Solirubrobacteraceae bacterium]|nr:AIM24 family protein [Solirubrobacteraceae bacterium]